MAESGNSFENLDLLHDGAMSASHETVSDQLDDSGAFSDWSRQDVEGLARYVQTYKVAKDQVIYSEGAQPSGFCVLLDGKVGIYKQDEKGDPKQIGIVRQGKFIGEMSMIDSSPCSATAIALESATVLAVSVDQFEELNRDSPILGNKLLRKLARLISMRLRQTTGILVDYI